ncbi:MAG: hypothetical protein U5M51_14940 [Emticicia sp.]|nr:hypothetical protein [Emticicia sp.]
MKHYYTPEWLSYVFCGGIIFLVFKVALLARKGNQKAFYAVLGFFGVYMSYISYASFNGWFDVVSFPPRVLRITTLFFVVFLFLILANIPSYKLLMKRLTLHDLIRVHIFRLVGVTFLLLAFYDALPKTFALIAGCGDMITALSSIYVAKKVEKGATNARKLAYIWNTFGFVDIVFTAFAANYLTKVSIDTGSMGVDTLARFPFCFIPAIAPPLIWFLHSAIYKKLNETSPTE